MGSIAQWRITFEHQNVNNVLNIVSKNLEDSGEDSMVSIFKANYGQAVIINLGVSLNH